jgi:ClpX C4-type zinc finger/Stress responsive A/B Barrel Domain
MITYSVALYPRAEVTDAEMQALLRRIEELQGAIPGIVRIDVQQPLVMPSHQERVYHYTMYFNTRDDMDSYTAHVAYQPVGEELRRLCPRSTVAALSTELAGSVRHGPPRVFRCSFCGKRNEQVKHLIAGPNGVYICDECVKLGHELMQDTREQPDPSQS